MPNLPIELTVTQAIGVFGIAGICLVAGYFIYELVKAYREDK